MALQLLRFLFVLFNYFLLNKILKYIRVGFRLTEPTSCRRLRYLFLFLRRNMLAHVSQVKRWLQ